MTKDKGQRTKDHLVAVDIGNTRLKLGLYDHLEKSGSTALPIPRSTLDVVVDQLDRIADWLSESLALPPADVGWWIGSVQRSFTTELLDWLRERDAAGRIRLLCSEDLPLVAELPRPDMVGIDRLLAAVGANRLRSPDQPAVIVDLGTAVTVDLVSAAGAFQGGAILPGIAMSARALHEYTDLLPQIEMTELHAAPAEVGKDTKAAMRSGLFWGTLGAARELISRMTLPGENPEIFLTGGAAASVAKLLAPDARYEPNLTLGGIAITARHARDAGD
jgi:type III pantothenate kinase